MNLSKKQVQSEEAWQNQMAEKILRFVQNELYQDLRFLDVALSALAAGTGTPDIGDGWQ